MIYFLTIIGIDDSPIKIGYTSKKTPYKRVASLQTGSPWPFKIEAVMPGDMNLDKELREQFNEHQCCMGGGLDWFYPNEKLWGIIKKARKLM